MKKIFLSQDKFTLVDDDDYEELSQYKWHFFRNQTGNEYARKGIYYMHRIIMKALKSQIVDHIDGNGLNNIKANLRICTKSENAMNAKIHKNHKVGLKGVYFDPRFNKYRAYIGISGRTTYLGTFNHKEEAAMAYDQAAKEHFGEFANVNFKEVSNGR